MPTKEELKAAARQIKTETSEGRNTALRVGSFMENIIDYVEQKNVSTVGGTGPRGPKGEKGEKGDRGDRGPKGDRGDDGKSAYQLAVQLGFRGTLQEWINSLKAGTTTNTTTPTGSVNGLILPELNLTIMPGGSTSYKKKTFLVTLSEALSAEMMALNPAIVLLRKKRTGSHTRNGRGGRKRQNKIKWVQPGADTDSNYVEDKRSIDDFVFPLTESMNEAGKLNVLENNKFPFLKYLSAQDIAARFTKILTGSRKGFEVVRNCKQNIQFFNEENKEQTAFFDLMAFCIRIDNPNFTTSSETYGHRTERQYVDGHFPYLYGPKVMFRVGLVKKGTTSQFKDFDIAVSLKE